MEFTEGKYRLTSFNNSEDVNEKQATITKWTDLLQDLEFSVGSAFCTLQLEICTFAEIEAEGQPQAVAQTSRAGACCRTADGEL